MRVTNPPVNPALLDALVTLVVPGLRALEVPTAALERSTSSASE